MERYGPPASTAIRAPTASRPPTASKLKEGRRPAAIRAGRQTPPRPGPQAPALSLVAPTPCASGRTQQSGPGLVAAAALGQVQRPVGGFHQHAGRLIGLWPGHGEADADGEDRKSTRLNSSHVAISYAVVCLKKNSGRRSPACP